MRLTCKSSPCLTLAPLYNPGMSEVTLELMRMAWPADWRLLFGRQAPLGVEIGFGNGAFLLDMALRRPEWNFLGIEIATPSIKRTENRILSARADNIRLVRGGARSVLQLLCQHGSIQAAIINFPDPWPKASHSERRLISKSFLELLASRMAEQATLDIATDHADYGLSIAENLRDSPYFESRINRDYVRDDPGRIRTKYERKGLAAGSGNYYFNWRRNSVVMPDSYPLLKELPMPHAIISCPLTLQEIAVRFKARHCATKKVSIRLIDLFRSQRRPAIIVDTYIAEQALAQRLMIEIYQRPDGDYLIRLQPTGFPRTTRGVHRAIKCLIEWLAELDGQTRVKRHNLSVPIADEQLNNE